MPTDAVALEFKLDRLQSLVVYTRFGANPIRTTLISGLQRCPSFASPRNLNVRLLAHRALDQPVLQLEMEIALTEMVQRRTRRLYRDKIQFRWPCRSRSLQNLNQSWLPVRCWHLLAAMTPFWLIAVSLHNQRMLIVYRCLESAPDKRLIVRQFTAAQSLLDNR